MNAPEKSRLRVTNPPDRPLMIWDGSCDFCRLWINRWRTTIGRAVAFATSQEMADRFKEIPTTEFERSVIFVSPDGVVFSGAEAVYRSLAYRPSKRWLERSYDHVAGFAAVSEFCYRVLARNRTFASALTRLFWGKDARAPTYFWACRWFLRLLGLVYLIAFVSLWAQIDGLIGANGILPVSQFLPAVQEQIGQRAYSILPTLCWFNSSNAFLHFLCGGGALLSLLLIAGIAPALTLLGLFVFYLSLAIAGQTFLGFQWDILLIEAGFLSIFLAPWRLLAKASSPAPVSGIGLFLLKLLLFKLMLMSGVVKLTSGDDCWWNLTALDYHYWSQPLPTVFAWWADQHAEWFKKFSVALCLFIEIIVPFFIWAPRRARLVAALLLIFLQVAIALTGNYCFFNLLTIALCLLLIDDQSLPHWRSRPNESGSEGWRLEKRAPDRIQLWSGTAVLLLALPVNGWLIFSAFKPMAEPPRVIAALEETIEPFRIVNGYGLFRVMTKDRSEIVLEGSADGIEWTPDQFKWKPGDVRRAPGWCAPHQPRLDWQMWFAALGSARDNIWFIRLAACLLENKPDVTALLARNPFPKEPPRFVRGEFYRYRFTTSSERRETGAWWRRQEVGEYLQPISLR